MTRINRLSQFIVAVFLVFPVLPVRNWRAQLRLVLFAPDQNRNAKRTGAAIYGDDLVNFIKPRSKSV